MRIISVSIVSLILLYVFFQGARFLWLVHISKGLVEKSAAFERILPTSSMNILVIGDSTAVGTGVSDSKDSTAGRFGSDFPSASVQNISMNGWKVADALAHFPVVSDQEFNLIVMQIGANDIIRGTPLDQFTALLDQLFDRAQKAGKQVVALHSGNIGLAPLFPWPVSAILRSRTLRYREAYIKIAGKYDVAYVDLYKEKSADPFYAKEGFYAEDGLHLTAKGYGFWYEQMREKMQ